MSTRIRLQRRGKKHQPFYTIVVADSRAPRDGRFIERLGYYDPLTDPATIEIDIDRALYWLKVGAQPSDTAKSLLSHKGVMLKFHLWKGIQKGALTEEQAEQKFEQWLKEKEQRINKAKEAKLLKEKQISQQRLEHEKQVRIKREQLLAERLAAQAQKATEKIATSEEPTEEAEEN
jgi:small subunit ribosomal protein S16